MYSFRVWMFAFVSVCILAGPGLAQSADQKDVPAAAEQNKKSEATMVKSEAQTYRPKVDTSASDAALEELRYKHLWVAYGLIWLIVFVFMLRTYAIGKENRATLDTLKTRLLQLEQKDG